MTAVDHQPGRGLTRRRALTLIAAAAGLGISPGVLAAAGKVLPAPYRWRGQALGAAVKLIIYHPDPAEAARLTDLARAEIARLERIFSLYRADSALVALNREGHLDHPPPELVTLLARAQAWSVRSGGAFDVTVQPLWTLYRDHFAASDADPAGPPAEALATARALTNWRALEVETARITLRRPGMAITLNGIAQGYITDRVADLLAAQGLTHSLIDLGEIRALGARPDGRPWRVGIADPRSEGDLLSTIALADRAVATSAAAGMRFDPAGRHHHILDPAGGRAGRDLQAASVVARRAADADALSTALVAGAEIAPAALAGAGIETVFLLEEGASHPRRLDLTRRGARPGLAERHYAPRREGPRGR